MVYVQHVRDAVVVVSELVGASRCVDWVQSCTGAKAEAFKWRFHQAGSP